MIKFFLYSSSYFGSLKNSFGDHLIGLLEYVHIFSSILSALGM